MIAHTLIHITSIKINQRFGDATTRAGKSCEHFKRAKRLIGFQVMRSVI